jgi:hypothetical protein
MRDVYQALYDFGADVVVTGHDHDYEQFHRQDPDGVLDAMGIRQFVVGTGGTSLRPFDVILPNSAVRDSDTHGVLKLTLHPTSYEWSFVPISGGTFTDSGSRPCVGSAPAAAGGRGFAVGGTAGGQELVWTTGTAQAAYVVARFAGGAVTILPGPGYQLWTIPLDGSPQGLVQLPAVARRAMHGTGGVPTCYVVLALTGAAVTGNSDVVCAIPGRSTLRARGRPVPGGARLGRTIDEALARALVTGGIAAWQP